MSAAMKAPMPPGIDSKEWKQDAKGRWVHVSMIKDVDRDRDALVCELATAAKVVAESLAKLRSRSMGDVQAFVEMSAEQYGVKSPAKGNLTLYSFDQKYKIIRATAERMVFDERLQAAKTIIDECIHEWSQGSSVEIIALVTDAFKVDREGEVNTGRLLALKRLDIDHAKWKQAIKAIDESMHTAESRSYLRFYERNDETGDYEPIALDFSRQGGAR